MRPLGLALIWLSIGVPACTALLDTGSLQKGGTTTGAGGAGGDVPIDAGDESSSDVAVGEAGKDCMSDTDCLPGLDFNGCFLYVCADGKCQPPKPNTGNLGIQSTGPVETIMSATEIGYPSLLADGTDFVMAVWHRNGTATDVLVRKYPAYPQSPGGAELSALAPGMFRAYGSSPGLISRPALPRKIRFLLAADRVGDSGTGLAMRQVDIDVPTLNNNLKVSAMQPPIADLGVTGYDTKPRAFPPRMMANGLQEPAGMWVQQQKLYYFDGTLAAEGYSTKRVLGFVPLAGGGVHAALQTAAFAAAAGVERTELWSQGSATLVALDGDQSAPRRGVTATFTNESGLTANLVGWSFEPAPGMPQANYTAALCSGASCSSIALSMVSGDPDAGASQISSIASAMFPELASARVTGSMVDRDVVQTFEVPGKDPTQADAAVTLLFATASRFNIPSVDLTKSSSKPMNPSVFVVDAASAPTTIAPSDVVGPSSVAITSDGQVLIAWVVHPSANMAVLKARRYAVKSCQ